MAKQPPKSTHGGKREGAGRPPENKPKKRTASITISPQHKDVIKQAGHNNKLSTAIAYIADQLIQHGTVTLKR